METRTRLLEACPPLGPRLWFGVVLLSLTLPALSGCHSRGAVAAETQKQSAPTTHPADETKKINTNLLELERRVQQEKLSLRQAGENMAMTVTAEGVKLEIVTNRIDDEVEKQLSMPGVTLHHVSRKYNRVSASISDLASMHQLARVPEVVMIMPHYTPRTQKLESN